MAHSMDATDWPLKNTTTTMMTTGHGNVDGMNPYSPDNQYQDQNIRDAVSPRKQHDQKILFRTIVAFVLSLVSLAVSTGVTARLGVHAHTHLLVAWITISGGAMWLFIPLFFKLASKKRKMKNKRGEDGMELRRLTRAEIRGEEDTGAQPLTRTSTSAFPLAHLNTRDNISGQDHPRSLTGHNAIKPTITAITPMKPAVLAQYRAHEMPFETHPNPLTSSPTLGNAPPTFPSVESLRTAAKQHHYSRSVYSSDGPQTPPGMIPDAGYAPDEDPFGVARAEARAATLASLTAGYVHEVQATRGRGRGRRVKKGTAV
ncbi:hypothetical protein B0A55_09867 [Friedmanniomyces simplex]|uniref:Uncharacterized protein n=1 Tax=Friedmanniomyces simplex TaxID=329884 RepID=A0A4U0WQ71_9PEZI|nr:hypothetical protein B0A55_09867 [Friedmanniomyces simplex]